MPEEVVALRFLVLSLINQNIRVRLRVEEWVHQMMWWLAGKYCIDYRPGSALTLMGIPVEIRERKK